MFNTKKLLGMNKLYLLLVIIFILLITIFSIKLICKQNKKERLENKNNDFQTLDNSGYLSLKDDINADDAKIVSENIKGIVTGSKLYPLRNDGKKIVYLTFDDGPSTTNTPKILDILDRYKIKATFFVLGKLIDNNNDAIKILKDQVKRGHAIGNHTYSHEYSYLYPNGKMNVENILEEINKTNSIFKNILGKDFFTKIIRFPGGYWSWDGREPMRDKMEEYEYYNIDWNAVNGDSEGNIKNSDELFKETVRSIENLGDKADTIVVLMHDAYGKEETVKALPRIIDYLKERGFEFRTIK